MENLHADGGLFVDVQRFCFRIKKLKCDVATGKAMEKIVIVGYRPIPGKESALEELMKSHWNVLNEEGLVSDRKSIICKANDGTIVEVFGWKSEDAIKLAHSNERVQRMWAEYSHVCEYVPIGDLEESRVIFSEFSPL